MKRFLTVGALALVAAVGAVAVPAAANAATWKSCGVTQSGLGVMANDHTSCQFARATARKVGLSFPRTVRPYSTALHRRIVMRRTGCGCSSFKPFIYRGGSHATVRFSS